MPAKVISSPHNPQSNGSNMTDTFSLQPGSSDFPGIEDPNTRGMHWISWLAWSAGCIYLGSLAYVFGIIDGRLRKKLQKPHLEGPKFSRQPEIPLPAEPEDIKSSQSNRRRPSLRNHKVPQGARPLTRSPSKYQYVILSFSE